MMNLNRNLWHTAVRRPNGIITACKQVRHLYSNEELGVKKYEESRKVVEHAIANHNFFKEQFKKQLLNPEFNFLSLELGLKNLIHIMKSSQFDIELLKDALRLWVQKRNTYKGEKYRFGTLIMRMFHFYNIPDAAIDFFEDEMVRELFTQVTGYQVLLDMLYENQRYTDVIRIYEDLNKNRRLYQNKYIDVLILASYYRLNNMDSLQKALDLWNKMSASDSVQFRKSRTFVAGLAVNQNQPKVALQILEGETTYVTMRHVKLMAWAQLGEFDKIFEMFRTILKRHEEEKKYNPKSSKEVLDHIKRAVKEKGSPKDIKEYDSILDQIQSLDLVTKQTFDEILCAPFPQLPQANIYHKKN